MNTFFHTSTWVNHCSVWKDLTEMEFLNIEKSIKKWREKETLIVKAVPRTTKMWPSIWKMFTFNQNELLKKLMFSPFGWRVHCQAGLTSVGSWSASFSQKKNIAHNVDGHFHEENLHVWNWLTALLQLHLFYNLFMASCREREIEGRTRCLWFTVRASRLVLILKWQKRKK